MQKIEAKRELGVHQVGRGIKQQRYTLRILRVNREVECLLLFDPSDAERQRATLSLLPSGVLRKCAHVISYTHIGKREMG